MAIAMTLSNGSCHLNTVYTNMTYKEGKIPTQDEIDKGLKEINRRKKAYEEGKQLHNESDREFLLRLEKNRDKEIMKADNILKLKPTKTMKEYRESKCQISLEQGKAIGCILIEPTKIKIFDRMCPLLQ